MITLCILYVNINLHQIKSQEEDEHVSAMPGIEHPQPGLVG
jgi:hypothetical protein